MAAIAAVVRPIFRSSPLRDAAARAVAGAKASVRPPLCLPKRGAPAAPRFFRTPVEMSCAVESLLPMHSATASASMTSMLLVSRLSYGWLSEASLIFLSRLTK